MAKRKIHMKEWG